METKLIVLIDPLNPIGTAYTKDEIKEIAEIAKEKLPKYRVKLK